VATSSHPIALKVSGRSSSNGPPANARKPNGVIGSSRPLASRSSDTIIAVPNARPSEHDSTPATRNATGTAGADALSGDTLAFMGDPLARRSPPELDPEPRACGHQQGAEHGGPDLARPGGQEFGDEEHENEARHSAEQQHRRWTRQHLGLIRDYSEVEKPDGDCNP